MGEAGRTHAERWNTVEKRMSCSAETVVGNFGGSEVCPNVPNLGVQSQKSRDGRRASQFGGGRKEVIVIVAFTDNFIPEKCEQGVK